MEYEINQSLVAASLRAPIKQQQQSSRSKQEMLHSKMQLTFSCF
jgi:hypothetical protein